VAAAAATSLGGPVAWVDVGVLVVPLLPPLAPGRAVVVPGWVLRAAALVLPCGLFGSGEGMGVKAKA